MALMAHMGFRDWQIPQFGGYLVYELHREIATGKHVVRVAYNPNPSVNDPGAVPSEQVLTSHSLCPSPVFCMIFEI